MSKLVFSLLFSLILSPLSARSAENLVSDSAWNIACYNIYRQRHQSFLEVFKMKEMVLAAEKAISKTPMELREYIYFGQELMPPVPYDQELINLFVNVGPKVTKAVKDANPDPIDGVVVGTYDDYTLLFLKPLTPIEQDSKLQKQLWRNTPAKGVPSPNAQDRSHIKTAEGWRSMTIAPMLLYAIGARSFQVGIYYFNASANQHVAGMLSEFIVQGLPYPCNRHKIADESLIEDSLPATYPPQLN